MPAKRPITIQGHTFNSLSDAAKYFGINRNTLAMRLKQFPANDPRVVKNPHDPTTMVTVAHQQYFSYRQAAKELGLNYWTLLRRLKRYDANDPRVIAPGSGQQHDYSNLIVAGKQYDTLKAAAQDIGIHPVTLINRIHRYGPNDPRVIQTDQPHTGTPITISGHEFPSITTAAKYYHLNPRTMLSRLEHYGPNDPRVTAPAREHIQTDYSNLVVDGHHFHSLTEAAKYYGLSISIVLSRIEQENADPTDLQTYRPKGSRRIGHTIKYRGTTYPNISAMCRATGIKRHQVYQALKNRIDIDTLHP